MAGGTELEIVTLKIRAADIGLDGQDVLSEKEHERLSGMHEGARPAFVTARSMLRHSLADYMGLTPFAVPLVQEGAGKRIYLDGFDEHEPPFYSVSHTGGAEDSIAAVTVSDVSPVGIDIQQLDPVVDWARVAERRFPASEWALLSAMPEEEARMLFFTLWAIKESFVKMEDGTLMPYLRGIELDLSGDSVRLVSPTPKGVEDAFIYFHFLPEFHLVIALVSEKPIKLNLDCDIRPSQRRADPFDNTNIDTDENAA